MRFNNEFARRILSKLLSKAIFERFGYVTDIRINDADISTFNDDITIRVNAELKISRDQFENLILDAIL